MDGTMLSESTAMAVTIAVYIIMAVAIGWAVWLQGGDCD